MDLKQILSKSTASLLSPSKLGHLQTKPVNDVEQPIIIPLGGAASVNNPLGLVPIHVINPQLLVPLDAIQGTKESALLFQTPNPTSTPATSSPFLPKPEETNDATYIRSKEGKFGISLSTNGDGGLNYPVGFSSSSSSAHRQSSLSQHLSVQYADPLITQIKKEITDPCEETPSDSYAVQDQLPFISSSSCSEMTKCQLTSHTKSTSNIKTTTGNNVNNSEKEKFTTATNDSKPCPDRDGLSKIISNLPPGWKVIGLTNLVGADGSQSTSSLETQDLLCNAGSNFSNSLLHLQSPHHQCRVPDVVSIDLNNPTTSSLSPGIFSDNFDSQKIDNILLPMNLSSSLSSRENKSSPEKSCVSQSLTTGNVTTTARDFPVHIKKEPSSLVPEESLLGRLDSDTPQSEWRVVGLTSSPLFPSTCTPQQLPPTIPLPVPVVVPSEIGISPEDRLLNSRSPKATILNVPSPKLLQHSVKMPAQHKSQAPGEVKGSGEEMKWTIVGVTVASSALATASLTSSQIGKDSLGGGGGGSVVNLSVSKADCEVTNSQQRPVSSSVSKNAPLSTGSSQKGIDSAILNNQWKVVGVAQSSNKKSSPQIMPLGYQLPVQLPQQLQPLLVTSITSSLPTTTTTATSAKTLSTGQKSELLSAPGFPSLSSEPHLQNSLLGKLVSSPELKSLASPSLLPLPASLEQLSGEQQQHLLQLVHNHLQQQQQQELHQEHQLMMNQFSVQNHLSFLNNMSNWNVVGLLSDATPTTTAAASATAGTNNARSAANSNMLEVNGKEKKAVGYKKIEPKNALDYSEHLASAHSKATINEFNDSNKEPKKSRQNRSRDASAKFTKKNTVSHLLKLKRMKMKGGDDCSSSPNDLEGCDSDNCLRHEHSKLTYFTRVDRDIRSRPLHSYAGNRKLFSKSYSLSRGAGQERISLRSGAQVPVESFPLEEEQNGKEIKTEPWCDVGESEGVSKVLPPPVVDIRSAARKRKLKIPRKMIADLDYQPFDSSSDSN